MDVTKVIQIDLKEMMVQCCCLACEAKEIDNAYWDTNANTLVSALSSDTDAATLETKLTKAEYIAGITMVQNLFKMFNNEAVSTADYEGTCNLLRYGSHATGSKLSEATEEIGNRMKQLAVDMMTTYGYAKKVLQIYNAEEVGDMIANLDNERRIPGSNMNKQQLNAAITYCSQFVNFMTSQAVTTGDYATTVAQWQTI